MQITLCILQHYDVLSRDGKVEMVAQAHNRYVVDVSGCRITAVKKSDKVVCAPIIFQCFSPPLQQNPQDQHKINIAASSQFVRLPLKLVMMIPSPHSISYPLSPV